MASCDSGTSISYFQRLTEGSLKKSFFSQTLQTITFSKTYNLGIIVALFYFYDLQKLSIVKSFVENKFLTYPCFVSCSEINYRHHFLLEPK